MRTIYKYFHVLAAGILIGFLAACASASTPLPIREAIQPSDSPESTLAGPVVGTAEPGESQGLPQPTPTRGGVIEGGTTVTLEMTGQTLILQPGDRFILALGEGYSWAIDISQPEVVSEVIGLTPVKGSQGVFEAHQAGQAMLSASGDPLCRNERPACMQPSIAFTLKIVVR